MTVLPITDEWLKGLFSSSSQVKGVVAAVSGGPDSIALMHLLVRWRNAGGSPLWIATVDHGLRSESATEAAFVGLEAERLGLQHRILPWSGQKPKTGLQEAARIARYSLLTAYAKEIEASHILTAHTLDDQAETILMRMARGSGLAGLAGMSAERLLDGIIHARPLLGVSKSTLVTLCQYHGWSFITDPSNANERFARTRWRRLMPALAEEGLTAARLSALAARLSRAEKALDLKAQQAFSESWNPVSHSLDGKVLISEPFEIALRILELSLLHSRFSEHPMRLKRLEAALSRLQEAFHAGKFSNFSLAGTVVSLGQDGIVSIRPESPRRRGR